MAVVVVVVVAAVVAVVVAGRADEWMSSQHALYRYTYGPYS